MAQEAQSAEYNKQWYVPLLEMYWMIAVNWVYSDEGRNLRCHGGEYTRLLGMIK